MHKRYYAAERSSRGVAYQDYAATCSCTVGRDVLISSQPSVGLTGGGEKTFLVVGARRTGDAACYDLFVVRRFLASKSLHRFQSAASDPRVYSGAIESDERFTLWVHTLGTFRTLLQDASIRAGNHQKPRSFPTRFPLTSQQLGDALATHGVRVAWDGLGYR